MEHHFVNHFVKAKNRNQIKNAYPATNKSTK